MTKKNKIKLFPSAGSLLSEIKAQKLELVILANAGIQLNKGLEEAHLSLRVPV
jgi:hypothetical protein